MESFPVQEPNCGEPRNPYYEKDILQILRYNKWILSSIGIWPIRSGDTNRYLPKLVIGLCNGILFFAIVPCTLHITFELKDTVMRLKLLGLLTFCVTSFFKYWVLAACRSGLRECVECVQNDWKQVERGGDRESMLKYGNVGRNLTLLCLVFMYTGGMMYHTLVQYAIGSFVDEQNRTIRPVIYPAYSGLYDPQRTPIYELVYGLHFMCGYVIYSVAVGACGLAALFVTHVCGQINIIMSRLENLIDRKKNTDPGQRLIEIVEHHIRTLRFSTKIERLLQEVCFVEFIGSTFLICLLEYYTITDWEFNNTLSLVTYFILLMSLTFNIYLLCYIGELLVEKTSNVGLFCFTIDWYCLPTETVRGLVLIIAMSRNPAKITAGRVADLNLYTFVTVLKTSLAYLSFLRTTVME
ncbi:PREDICTED: odorant receptor 4-like [Dufourea novaeangliae]|uniref:odorant receptor 4-like n=1 Tax=Dufourea novaeangliae TaxID=178035 RepID=UPI000767186B|nr:PREDICTED: odorant receptor 4-like [Dufourea novaeangliae]